MIPKTAICSNCKASYMVQAWNKNLGLCDVCKDKLKIKVNEDESRTSKERNKKV